jgi:4'-phosphopantetheinyl transferase
MLRGEVHVWHSSADDAPPSELILPVLEAAERDRASRFVFPEHQRLFIAAHGALRTLLGMYLGVPPETVRFRNAKNGKPELAAPAGVHFNLSHTSGAFAIATAAHGPVGVDIEKIRAMPDWRAVALRFFSPAEIAWIENGPQAEQLAAFFTCWTGKEAYLKATGAGLGVPLSSFSVLPRGDGFDLNVDARAGDAKRWSVRPVRLDSDLRAAVAAEGHDWRLRVFEGAKIPWNGHLAGRA